MQDCAWIFGTLLNAEDYTKSNLWRDRLAYQVDAVAVLGEHTE